LTTSPQRCLNEEIEFKVENALSGFPHSVSAFKEIRKVIEPEADGDSQNGPQLH